MEQLVDLIYSPLSEWEAEARAAFAVTLADRYVRVSEDDFGPPTTDRRDRFQLRVNVAQGDKNVPFVALTAPGQERSGPYGGMSFVLFPASEPDQPALITMVVGTNGISPDELVLGRPGHARKMRAITTWLRGQGLPFTWAKQDPVRTDLSLPRSVTTALSPWDSALKRYGNVTYAIVAPPRERTNGDAVATTLTAFLDTFFKERDIAVLAKHRDESIGVERRWMASMLPDRSAAEVADHLSSRKYVVIEGPPGTGKTKMALDILRDRYGGNGRFIQFHPGTTYDTFVGGLFPEAGGQLGFEFAPRPGHLMTAAAEARASGKPFLLVVDEINRADLSKVLGEAITLFEPNSDPRSVTLGYRFEGIGDSFSLPANLHVLGTMNSADRSIAILDLAVRRRFAFLQLWPQLSVVEQLSGERLQDAFASLLELFVEHAPEDAFALMPGHAYFLADDVDASKRLKTEVAPLLREYLAQGYVAGFADEVQAWLNLLAAEA